MGEKKKFHVHVYKVVGLVEMDLEAETDTDALDEALRIVKEEKPKFEEPDNEFITVTWNEDND